MAELMANAQNSFISLKKGEKVTGTVKKLTPKEILLDIGYKSDALVIEYDKQNLENLLSLLTVGDTVTASVISPESEEGFPVVSLRRMLEDKVYSGLQGAFDKDAELTATIAESTRGGFFVTTTEGMKGFLPNSQLHGERVAQGDKVQVKVIEIDREKKKVIVSQKAIAYLMNAAEITKLVKKDDKVKAKITNISPYGLYVVVEPKSGTLVEGFIHISEVSHQRVEELAKMFTVGQELEVAVIDVDRDNKRVNLSLKKLAKDVFEDVKKDYKAEQVVKATVSDVTPRGVMLQIAEGVSGFIASSKVPTDTTYEKGQSIEVEVVDFDDRKRLVNVSPILKTKFIGYR